MNHNLRPKCCGRNTVPVRKTYPSQWFPGGSWVEYFSCKVCGRHGVPFMTDWDNTYMESLEAVRLAGIEFDKTFA